MAITFLYGTMWCLLSIQPLWMSCVKLLNNKWDTPPPSSCVWPPPWLGLVSGCPVEPSMMPGHRSWKRSDRKHNVTSANLFKHWCTFLFLHIIMLLSRKGTGSLQEMKDPPSVFVIPSTAFVALQSSEGRILKPALLPVIKKIIIIM